MSVPIVDLYATTPVYHADGDLVDDLPGKWVPNARRAEDRTACGLVLSYAERWTTLDGDFKSINHDRSTRLPLKHAEKFARPCKRCFGGEG